MNQTELLAWYENNKTYQDYNGTFADNTKAPIHRWFKYPAGYSYKLVENKISEYRLNENSWILDPFVGCGTTSVVAKEWGVNSIGIDPHPFVYWVAKTKTFWDFDLTELRAEIELTIEGIQSEYKKTIISEVDLSGLPNLVHKCYSPHNLAKLKIIRDFIEGRDIPEEIKNFLKLGLTNTLRVSSKAGTGWPYIAPSKYHEKAEKDAYGEFAKQIHLMYKDIRTVLSRKSKYDVVCELICGDSGERHHQILEGSIDLAITSPPYLNNYDYADRTRLELYFFGLAKTWGDITKQIRDKLMIAATTQVRRSEFNPAQPLNLEIMDKSPKLYEQIMERIRLLSKIRTTKGGKKSYDYMVSGYFNDMFRSLEQVKQVLKKDCDFILILGDSAPYGIHVPTEQFLGEMALGLGYSDYKTEILRVRGLKWAKNPQRHKVLLKESILNMTK